MAHSSAPSPAWTTTPARRTLFAALGAPAVDVRYVGGCVRNWLMEQSITDIDIGTPEEPARVIARLEAARIKVVPTGIAHGTVTAVADGEPAEITSLRRDTACDGRHAAVEFTQDWEEDARRRDFTINAMSLRPDGALFDYHGGLADARAGRVRFVGNADDRIQEDYLRILRLFRFFAWYGRLPLDGETRAAVGRHRAGLARLSVERIAQELVKLLAASDPAPAVALMRETGVLAAILPVAAEDGGLAALIRHERALEIASAWPRRFAVLLPLRSGERVAQHLKLSNAETARLAALTEPAWTAPPTGSESDRLLYHCGAEEVIDRLLISWSRAGASGNDQWRHAIEAAREWREKTLPVGGADVLALGLMPGPLVGELLDAVEAWWIEAGFVSKEETLAELRRRVLEFQEAAIRKA